MPRIKASDIANLKLSFPKESYGKLEDYTKEFDINLGIEPKSSKSNLKKDIEDTIKEVKSHKMPKKTKSKDISTALEITDMIINQPKIKKVNKKDIDSVMNSINSIQGLLKAKKPKAKLMQQSKGYTHQVNNVSDKVMNYVNEYKSIMNSGLYKGTKTKNINKLKLNVMSYLKPSEADDAAKLIADYRKTLPSTVKAKVTKSPKAPKAPDDSYKGHKKYKSLTLYVKNKKPEISDSEDIDIIVQELIDKNIPRMSVTKLQEVLSDLGY